MKFSKNYKNTLDKYTAIKREYAKHIEEVEKARPEALEGQRAAAEAMKKAAETGDAKVYQEAKIKKQDFSDNLEFLDKRISALQIKPLAEEKDVSAMLKALEAEEEELRKEVEGPFTKKILALLEEAEDMISMFHILSYGRGQVKREVGRIASSVDSVTTPRVLLELDKLFRSCLTLQTIKAEEVDNAPLRRPLTENQKKEFSQEQGKWA